MTRTLLLAVAALLIGIGIGWTLFASPGTAVPAGPGPPPVGVEASLPDPTPVPGVSAPPATARSASPTAGSGPSTAVRSAPASPPGIAEGRGGGSVTWDRDRLLAEIESALRLEYAAKAGRDIPGDLLRARADALLRNIELNLRTMAGRTGQSEGRVIGERTLLRDKAGSLADPVDVLLQVRGLSRNQADMVGLLQNAHVQASTLATEPLVLDAPLRANEPSAAYVRGGLVPEGKVLVVERVELSALPGNPPGRPVGGVELEVNGPTLYGNREVSAPFRMVWTGSAPVRPGEEGRVRLEVNDGVAGVRILGRLIDESAATATSFKGLAPLEAECTGFLRGGRIVLQVLTDGGGGNPRRVHLDGTPNGYLRQMSAEDLAERGYGAEEFRGDLGFSAGGGNILPGKRLKVVRVDVRGRFLTGNQERQEATAREKALARGVSREKFEQGVRGHATVRVGGRDIMMVKRTLENAEPDFQATWTDGAWIDSGKEKELYIETDTRSFIEAVVTTQLE